MPLFGPPNIEKLKQKGDVGALIKALEHKHLSVQTDAVLALGEIGAARAVEPLITVLRLDSGVTRIGAAFRTLDEATAAAFGKIGTPAVEPLITALEDSDERVRAVGVKALVKIGEPAVEPLVAALDHGNRHVRAAAKKALTRIGGERAKHVVQSKAADERAKREEAGRSKLEPLIEALSQKDPRKRQRAAERISKSQYVNVILRLEESGDYGAEQAVVAALKDEDEDVRRAALAALGRIGSSGATKALTETLDDGQQDPAVRAAAGVALRARGSAPPVDALITTPDDAFFASELLVACYDRTPRGEGFLMGSYSARDVEDIGRQLDALGGFELMLDVHALFARRRPRAARNLEMVWDGVGRWQG